MPESQPASDDLITTSRQWPFDGHAEFDPEGDFEAFLKKAPARWVVYLLADAQDRPVQLLCVKNLRASLKRRLGVEQIAEKAGESAEVNAPGLSRKVNYRELVRRVHWRRVDSAFEADWQYFDAARQVFPQTYRGMVGFRPAWFVHVNPEANFPRLTKTIDLSTRTGMHLGPIEDKHAAARLIELIVDAFDLCRYYSILVQAPNGNACAYKEMGKCPAPCDGSISMPQYRRMMQWGVETAISPDELVRLEKHRMQQAADEFEFEAAAKIKAYVDQLSQFGKGPFRHSRPLSEFRFLSVQSGPRAGTAKLFLITPGGIEEIAGLIDDPGKSAGESSDGASLLQWILVKGQQNADEKPALDAVAAERIGIVAHHLFSAKRQADLFIRLDLLEDRSLAQAYRELMKQASRRATGAQGEDSEESEGLMKELQAMDGQGATDTD